jgi:hypothetical protein
LGKRKRAKPKTIIDLRKHAKRRAFERYGLELNKADYNACVKIIQDAQSEPILEQSNTRTWHKIKYKDKEALVVYDRKRHGIVTFLPKDADKTKDKTYDD